MSNIVDECGDCPKQTFGDAHICRHYPSPKAFIRDNGMFMCPTKGYAKTQESKSKAKVRVGQQKQKGRKLI